VPAARLNVMRNQLGAEHIKFQTYNQQSNSMKLFLTTLFILVTVLISNGQTTDYKIEKEYIEVMSEAEIQVVPDEIYIGITIRERYEGREKITLDSIE